MATKHPSSRRYPHEVKQRAVQLVLKTMDPHLERAMNPLLLSRESSNE